LTLDVIFEKEKLLHLHAAFYLTLLITITLEMALFKCVAGTLGNVSMRQFVMRPYFEN
jgi:hypothetical protein